MIAEIDQRTQTILNLQSINNELEQLVSSLPVSLKLDTTIHNLEKSPVKRKPESSASTKQKCKSNIHLNDNNLYNTNNLNLYHKTKKTCVMLVN